MFGFLNFFFPKDVEAENNYTKVAIRENFQDLSKS